ncbi:hypothetical protein SAMN06297129_3546 [Pseudooceanicola antarcticus]|uniref:Uncharacterized protein n=1 Tax=Pseudooceanicola antarcticus TaxID=1247613 RepID=A0A285JD71_9RHOB|nr:hypothetical protein [Pseudooceanicola antarcticus]SNY58218.1 hypothetical protein SAMN06297129_3546 [Pseudooceanicola antarcticus]
MALMHSYGTTLPAKVEVVEMVREAEGWMNGVQAKMKPEDESILWTAPLTGHDWTCPDTLRAIEWFRSLTEGPRLESRLDACRVHYEKSREAVEDGYSSSLFDPRDSVAWYILQAESYATDRRFWTPDEAARIVPYIRRIGQLRDHLSRVDGVEDRVARFINGDGAQPDGPIFELLVAGAWVARGYSVRFIPEQLGGSRTPDLEARKKRSRWAIEAKRMMPSAYGKRERDKGRKIAANLHDLCESLGHSVVVDVVYEKELEEYSDDFLASCVREFLPIRESRTIDHEGARITVRPVAWPVVQRVFAADYVFIGSSRMTELVNGMCDDGSYHDLRVRCRRANSRPSYADRLSRASLVNWTCTAPPAVKARAKHFKKKLTDAEGQLPDNCPGLIHVGMDSSGRSDSDQLRHYANGREAAGLIPGRSRPKWVYGNYFKVEATTRPNEALAMEETMAPYKVGRHRTRDPLPSRLLLCDDQDRAHWGAYWD